MRDSRDYSIFWPVLLIAVGVVWLLSNLNVIPAFNFSLLVTLWPLLLIVAGVNMIIGRRFPLLRTFITLAAVAFALLYVYLAPALGIVPTPEIQKVNLSEPIGEATSATIHIGSSVGKTTITALVDSSDLIRADLTYVGELFFDVSGTTEKFVDLNVNTDALNADFFRYIDENSLYWDIGLTPNIPLVLDFSGGVGDIELDLAGLTLSEIIINGGVGAFEITLPAQEGLYTAQVRGGVGSFTIKIEDGAEIDLDINAGVGDFVIEIPDDAGVELQATTGVGNIRVPARFEEIRPVERGVGVSGTWETANIANAEYVIRIEFEGGVGGLRIR